ncbi:MAG: S8/S53 family peptidase [Clostridia bacterium]|nr:S8/S53 family peptidase [Clostridia bacterium]
MKKFLAIFLTSIMLLSQAFIIVAGATPKSEANQEKLTEELKAEMETKKNNEYISIYIWLSDLGDDVVYSNLSNKLGKEINKNNEDFYVQEKVKNKVEKYNEKQKNKKNKKQEFDISEFRSEAEISEILTDEEIQSCLNDGKTYEQIIELSEQYQYISDYRDSREHINTSVNELFENNINRAKCRNVNIDLLLPYATMECKKSYISKLSTMGIVTEIGLIKSDDTAESQETIAEESSESEESDEGEYIMKPHNVPNNLGGGIKIGVIEEGTYDPNATHLQGKNITNYNTNTAQQEDHATYVLSILGGTYQIKDGMEYQGVAPLSNIYFVDDSDVNFLNSAKFHWLIVEKDVAVINISMAPYNSAKDYNNEDRYLDCLTLQYRITFVKSSGNGAINITAPGMGYNVITVGNVSNEKDVNDKYKVYSGSAYEEMSYLTNKPDLCAFGTNVHMLYNNAKTNFGKGTSFAAPQVTGTIALMMAENNKLIGKPDAVKAILVNTADSDAISRNDGNSNVAFCDNYTDNFTFENQIKEKSGAGLLNIEGAVSMARTNLIHRYAIPRTSSTASASKTTGKYYFEKDQEIEFTLVFEKPYDNTIESLDEVNFDFEIEMYHYNYRVMASKSGVNNVESFRVEIPESGQYHFRIKCDKLDSATDEAIEISENTFIEHTINHNYFYVSFVFSCGCELPSVEITDCYELGHTIVCDNCNSSFTEFHDHKSITQSYDDVDITYDVYYKVHTLSVSEYYPSPFCVYRSFLTPELETSNSENSATYVLNYNNIEYQNTKYWEILTFEIFVISPQYELVANFYTNLYINIYYDTGECDFEPPV